MTIDTVVIDIEAGRRAVIGTAPVDTPLAGHDFSWTGPVTAPFRVVSIYGQLLTSAVVATRLPSVELLDAAGNVLARMSPQFGQAASKTDGYTWANGLGGDSQQQVYNQAGLPLLWLPPRAKVASVTGAIDVGDQWSAVTISYLLCVE